MNFTSGISSSKTLVSKKILYIINIYIYNYFFLPKKVTMKCMTMFAINIHIHVK